MSLTQMAIQGQCPHFCLYILVCETFSIQNPIQNKNKSKCLQKCSTQYSTFQFLGIYSILLVTVLFIPLQELEFQLPNSPLKLDGTCFIKFQKQKQILKKQETRSNDIINHLLMPFCSFIMENVLTLAQIFFDYVKKLTILNNVMFEKYSRH